MTDEPDRPTVNQPLHGPRRKAVKPAVLVITILGLVLLALVVLGWLRYNT